MEALADGRNMILILLGFGLLVFVHELGHFLAARWAGIRCESFAVGMGPVVAAWRRGIGWRAGSTDPATVARFGKPAIEMTDEELERHGIGETEWSLRLLPLGGFVRMLGQDDLDPGKVSASRRSYQRAPIGRRMLVVSAGVLCNLVLAVLLFMIAFMVGVRFEAPVAGVILPDMPAASARALDGGTDGLRAGDTVVAIDGAETRTFADVQIASAMARPGTPLEVHIERHDPVTRADERRRFSIAPSKDDRTGLLAVGIAPALSGEIGVPAAREQSLFDATMRDAGLEPTIGPDGTADPLHRLVAVRVRGDDGTEADVAVAGAWNAEAGGALATAALDDAARASGGAPFGSTWITRSGRTVERMLAPVPAYQPMRVPAEGTAAAEVARGLVGLVPLLRVDRLVEESPNQGVLLPGDVLLAVAGTQGPRFAQLRAAITPFAGRAVAATVLRDGAPIDLDVRIDGAGRLGAMLREATDLPMVGSVVEAAEGIGGAVAPTAAAGIGILPRSTVVSVDGKLVADWPAIRAAFVDAVREPHARGEAASVSVIFRSPTPGHEEIEATLTLPPEAVAAVATLGWGSPVPAALFEPLMTTLSAHGNPLRAIVMGFEQTHTMVTMTYLTIDRLVRGTVGVDQLRGPVGIVHLGARVADRGAMYLITFLAMISVNLAVLNFLPLPIVDGGLFLYLLYEKFTGRPPSLQFQGAATALGLTLLGSLFVLTFYNDVVRLVSGG